MQYIKTYFPNLTPKQENQFTALGQLYTDWNAKINVISVSYTHLTLPTN